jgi:hypothetical protein
MEDVLFMKDVLENAKKFFNTSDAWHVTTDGHETFVTRKIEICDGTQKILKVHSHGACLFKSYHKQKELLSWDKNEGPLKLKEDLREWIGGTVFDLEQAYYDVLCFLVWIAVEDDPKLSQTDILF